MNNEMIIKDTEIGLLYDILSYMLERADRDTLTLHEWERVHQLMVRLDNYMMDAIVREGGL